MDKEIFRCIEGVGDSFIKGKKYEAKATNDGYYDFINEYGSTHTISPVFLKIHFIEEKKTYKGWEILKMIDEGKLKIGDKLLTDTKSNVEIKEKTFGENKQAVITWDNEEVLSCFLIARTFVIKEKEYMTFDEARKSGKRFRHKDMLGKYYSLNSVFYHLAVHHSSGVRRMLDEKAWEVES